MEYKKVMIDGEEVNIPLSVSEEEIENNDIDDITLDLTEVVKEIEELSKNESKKEYE